MRVHLKLVGLPDLSARLGGTELPVEFGGSTVGALLQWLQKTHADPARIRLTDRAGHLDPDVVLLRNDRELIPSDAHGGASAASTGGAGAADAAGYELADGDRLTLVVIVAGG